MSNKNTPPDGKIRYLVIIKQTGTTFAKRLSWISKFYEISEL